MRKLTNFIIWPILASVLVAVLMLVVFPQQPNNSIKNVQIKQIQPRQPAVTLQSGPVSYADAVKNAAPAVVNIYTATKVSDENV